MQALSDPAEKVRAALGELGFPRHTVLSIDEVPRVVVWSGPTQRVEVPDFVAWKALLLAGREVCWDCHWHITPGSSHENSDLPLTRCEHAPFTPDDIARMSTEARTVVGSDDDVTLDTGFWRAVNDHALATFGGTEHLTVNRHRGAYPKDDTP